MVCDTPPSQDASTHQIWNSYLKEYRRYAPDTNRDSRTDIVITIKTKSEVKVTVTPKWYATLGHPKMHPHSKFGIPTSKNIGDMHRTKRDGRTVRLLYASQSNFGGIKTTSSPWWSGFSMTQHNMKGAQWCSACLQIEWLRVRASPASLHCVLEQSIFILA